MSSASPANTAEKRPREESASADPRSEAPAAVEAAPAAAAAAPSAIIEASTNATATVGASRAARFDGRQMPDDFGASLGSGWDQLPAEAKDIEDTVHGHIDFDDLPEERKKALFAAVSTYCRKVTDSTTPKEMEVLQRQASQLKGFNCVARKSDLMAAYRHLVRSGEVPENYKVEDSLVKKKGKSHSGVLVVTVFFGPGEFSCPKDCHYCPNQPGIARSYLLREPGVLRGFRNNWDPIKQFYDRASALENNGHVVDKIELIILGGTFSFYPKEYAKEFITASFYAANTYYASAPFRKMGTLEEEITANETARCRIIGITAETRPDYISLSELRRFRELGITRVQLGIQHLDDDILDYINRECPTSKTVVGIQRLLDAGFKVDAHFMPDLPGSSYAKDREMFENLLGPDNELFQVDQWKVYPTATVPFTKIKEWYEAGTYKPYAEEDGGKWMVELLVFIMANCHHRIRLNRIIRDIPTDYISGGERRINLRQVIENKMRAENIKCHDIRERECKGAPIKKDEAVVFVDEFKASGGVEYYISIENPDRTSLYGHLRLRLRGDSSAANSIVPALTDCALIRELHTYGRLVAVNKDNTGKEAQHVGVGTQLMRKAEEIAVAKGFRRAAVIAGVGVRKYYAKLGYSLADTYMVKELAAPEAVVIDDALENEDNDNDNERVPMTVVGVATAALGKLKSLFS